MITSPAFSGRRYAVLGLARSGLATVAALLASGARVTAWDENEEARALLSSPAFAGEGDHAQHGGGAAPQEPPPPHFARSPSPRNRGEELELADPLAIDLAGYDGVVVSPGVPLNRHPIAAKAKAAGVPVIGDIELFAQARAGLPPHWVVGITGTNGKSTTTAVIHHILKTAGVPTTMGGNIGLPILAQDPLPEGGVYVLELSSYQIDLTFSLDCDIAVLLNVTPDHLDRYESFDAYAASKARLFEMQSAGHSAWFDFLQPVSCHIGDKLKVKRPEDVFFYTGEDWWSFEDNCRLDVETRNRGRSWPALRGPHNSNNAMAAANVARQLGITEDIIDAGLQTYTGLPHRMEFVGERRGVRYVNDSKATNPESVAPALAAFEGIHWLLGGQAKGDNLDPCLPYLDHVRFAYAFGEAGSMFYKLLVPRIPTALTETLEQAVGLAASHAEPGEVVLLSPACASFDQFRDYEARGDAFRAAVEALA